MILNEIKDLRIVQKKDKTTLYLLFQIVYESGFERITGAANSKQALETLEKVFRGVDRVKQVQLQILRGELEAMKVNETKGVSEYITRVQAVVNQLKPNGEHLS